MCNKTQAIRFITDSIRISILSNQLSLSKNKFMSEMPVFSTKRASDGDQRRTISAPALIQGGQQQSMSACVLTGFGGVDKYEIQNVVMPQPKQNEVLVKISAISINNTEINTRKGSYGDIESADTAYNWVGEQMPFPWIGGCDACGYIMKLGFNYSTDPRYNDHIGQRVLINPNINKLNKHNEEYLHQFLGSEVPGTYAEYISVPMDNVCIIPSSVPLKDYQLCPFLTAYISAQAMIRRGEIKANENVMISGASGGVGVALTQLVLNMNANPILIIGNKQKANTLLNAVNRKDIIVLSREGWFEELNEKYSEMEIDAILDPVSGNKNYNNYLETLRVGGRIVTVGAIAGSMVTINIRNVYLKWLKIIGSTCGTKQDFVTVMKYVKNGKLKPIIHKRFVGIRSIPEAQIEFMKKRHVGKIVVDYNLKHSKL
eukprot:795575_1